MTRETEHQQSVGVQVEINEMGYQQHREYALIEVTCWRSIEDCMTILFKETDPARGRIEPVGTLLGTVPFDMVEALESAGYEVVT